MSEGKKARTGIFGRPRIFDSVEEFEDRATEYFEANDGGDISWTGLCLAVGASSRQSLERYKKGEHGNEFVDSIKKALLIIENFYEEKKDGAKAIFILKNFEWKDSIDLGGGLDLTMQNKSHEQLDSEISDLLKKNSGKE